MPLPLPRKRHPLPVAIAVALLVAACGGGGGGDDDDGARVDVAGVSEPVEIVRDENGVSHIYAKNQRDLFVAQGYNAARDRLWQLDQWRRRGEGKMAEEFGPRFIEHDRAARLFLFRGNLEEEYASYHPDAKEILEAFADGINAYVDEVEADAEKLPIEFRLTGTKPGRWSATSSLIRIYGITRNVSSEVSMARRIAAVGLATTEELTVSEPPRPMQIPDGIDVDEFTPAILATYQLARNGLAFEAEDFPRSPLEGLERAKLAKALSAGNGTIGHSEEGRAALRYESNNWTVSGSKTASGKPILAGDPHRAIEMPSLRYMVHLNAPGWNVIGAGEPALPGVSMGHNERIAFGLTIFAFGDEEDLYVYDINPDDPNQYRYNGAWESMRIVEEELDVRGEDDATAELKFTRHGPVVFEDRAAGKAYAVRAAYLEFPGTAAYLASLRLNQARNWTEFTEGMARHFTPGENMVYADVDGNIGWFGGALAPIRPQADWTGQLPVPGDGRYEWAGYLPGSLLPRVFNPPEGFFATANEFNVPADYAYRSLSATSWAEPYRFRRAAEVLREAEDHTVEDSARLQIDELSIPAREIAPLLAGLSSDDADVNEALELLRDWDHVVSVDSVAATLHELWLPKLLSAVSALVIPEAGRSVFGTLQRTQVIARLTDPDVDTFGPGPAAARDALMLETLAAALADLEALQGSDRSRWNWGSLHHIQFEHELTPFLATDLAESLATRRYPVGGDGDTLHRGSYRTSDFRVTSGASYRQVIDLGDWDNSLAINVPGQSADPESPYYQNLIERWSKGEYFPMAFSREKVDSLKADTLTLRPGDDD